MKGKSLSLIGFLFLLIGVVAILFVHKITSEGVIAVCGVIFIASGVINLVTYSKSSKQKSGITRFLDQIVNAAAIVLGICMLVFMGSFRPMVAFIFGIIVAVCALWQFFVMAVGTRPAQLPGWLYIYPLLLVGGAVYLFVKRAAPDTTIVMAMSISLAVLGVGCICEGVALGLANKRLAQQSASPAAKPDSPAPTTAAADASKPAADSQPDAPKPAENSEK